MKTLLLKGKRSPEEKKQFLADWRAARPVLEQLEIVLSDKLRECNQKRKSRKNYFMPAWKEYQADCNGYSRALEEILNVLSDQEES